MRIGSILVGAALVLVSGSAWAMGLPAFRAAVGASSLVKGKE